MDEVSPAHALKLANRGEVLLVDVREPSQFALGHLQGSLHVPYSEKGLGERLALLSHTGIQIVVVADDIGEASHSLVQLNQSFFSVLGIVYTGNARWKELGTSLTMLPEVSLEEMVRMGSLPDVVLLDVRESIEWEMGYVPGAKLISLGDLRDRIREIPRDKKVVVICEAGIRSSSAASMLLASGFLNVFNVPDGTGAYRKQGFNLEFVS